MSEASPNTAQNWYVSRNDKQAGPYPGAVLKQLAATGKLLPTDLVWKDGSDVRKPASQIKGLFPSVPPTIPTLPNQVTEPRNLPPPLPKVNQLDSGSKTESTDRLDSHGIPTPTSSVHVSLWSPIAIFIWSFFLSPLFGSYLLYRNWKALGKSDLARRSLYWFYGYLGLFIFVFLGVCIGNELIPMLVGRIAVGGLIVWMIKEAAPHADYVNKNVGKAYERKSILKPLGVFGTCAFFLILVAGVLVSESGEATGTAVSSASEEEVINISSENLFKEYQDNTIAADKKYKGKMLQVSGSVRTISKNIIGRMYVVLNIGRSKVNGIQCFFSSSSEDKLTEVRPDQFLTIRGRCDGSSFLSIMLSDCIIIP